MSRALHEVDATAGAEIRPTNAEIASLLDAIFGRYHYDFRDYALASLKRRVATAVEYFGCASTAKLEALVVAEPSAFTELLRFLTVQVSELFRDPSYFRALRTLVVPWLRTFSSLKVWVAGCATGEEAYSIAILLEEEDLLARTQIYATDIHADSLRVGAEGIYARERFPKFSGGYLASGGKASLSDHYTAGATSAVFERRLRKSILFSDHSLATDTAFAEVQLVSCRNVLIYFDRALQDRAIGVLGSALCRKGYLGLGMKETLRFSAHASAFEEIARDERIYRKL